MVELVDTSVLGTDVERLTGSSPVESTMIFNPKVYQNSGITAEELVVLLIIKNKKYEYLESYSEELNSLFKKLWVKLVKGKKSDPNYMLARLTPFSSNFLRDLQIQDISDDAKILATALFDEYENFGYSEKIGNKRKVVSLLSWFLVESEINSETIINAVNEYLTMQDAKFIASLENLIWKPNNVYSTKPKLEESRLFKLIKK